MKKRALLICLLAAALAVSLAAAPPSAEKPAPSQTATASAALAQAPAQAKPQTQKSIAAPAPEKTKIVLARNQRAISDRNVCDAAETARLFDRAFLALTGAPTAAEGWKRLGLVPSDIVAVKLNCNNWTIKLSPHPELVDALCRSLQTVVPANSIILYDVSEGELKDGGFKINKSATGVRCFGVDDGEGFDAKEGLAKLLTQRATKIINFASLKCLDEKMVASLFFKNHIGSIPEKERSKCHSDWDFSASVLARPSIKAKTILNLCDGLRGSYKRGVPWYWKGIVMGRDPVAAEAAAIGIINEKRAEQKLDPMRIPEWLTLSESKYKLGTLQPARIDLVKIDL